MSDAVPEPPALRLVRSTAVGAVPDLDDVMRMVARGDEKAFAVLYDAVMPRVFGMARRVLRAPSLAEEVAQEVLVEVWRNATRFDRAKGTVITWILTIAHRRAVDRVRSEQALGEREEKVAVREGASVAFDSVSEEVETRLEHQQVRRCLGGLTELQRESIQLAYYNGYTYKQVGELLDVPLGTVKARMRDGLVRLRDCLGVGL